MPECDGNYQEWQDYIYGKNDTTPEQFQDYVNMKRKEIGNNENGLKKQQINQ